ncbi:M23 family metallopeptidase [Aetokthonos hydrillicola Thurmond2011]|jgi:lysostaphin|uniref:M23 family metallopeptidase n=2 Tax=Aetokthonos TaxID=1550243 RepID=A0AAP5I4G3_9CYAN|nr:M23 family metallopeptidase [Aetokthonos hydrillicola]MBO3460877.1 M23 family metallopeptidase [Aetokthonos hydrillicola CCALA 1050]MBW4585671.1 M23 family metallopeptidase [Aetokthonos hydrillicola CCALA 1050]MDR9894571.1 M23 family metallopeptidase [Aetokthonos hydrillicola Thurmond2011]
MKKATLSRFCTYGLIGLVSVSSIDYAGTSAVTKTADRSLNTQSSSSSNLIWPSQGIISQGFKKNRHIGIDIAAPPGTPIIAAATGQVVKSGWDDWGLGNAIRIHHSDGSFTVYGHNRRLLVRNGQHVNQGEVIAEMGTTGNSSGPHLHFEVHPDNMESVIDPIPVLPSLVAGKVPPQRLATSNVTTSQANSPTDIESSPARTQEISIPIPVEPPHRVAPPVTKQTSSSQSIPIAVASANLDTGCKGSTVIAGETATTRVKVCKENGQFFYIGQLKQNPDKPIKLPAWNVGSLYRADNGSFSYFVSPQGIEVWRNGSPMRSEIFFNTTHSLKP